MPDIVLHHLERSRSHRVLWLLEELALPYTLRTYPRDPATMRGSRALREVHPLGKSPVITIDGEAFAESGAIVEQLVEVAGGQLRPDPGTPEAKRYRFFLHYAEGSLMPPLLVGLIIGQLRTSAVPWPARPITRRIADQIDAAYTRGEIRNHVAFLEAELGARPFAAGEAFTAADCMLSYPLEALLSRAGVASPTLAAYLDRLRDRPAYARAVERGGPILLGA